MKRMGILVAAALLVSGCGGGDSGDGGSGAASSGPAPDEAGYYKTAEDLVEAGIEAGLTCPYTNEPKGQEKRPFQQADSLYCSRKPDGTGAGSSGLPTFAVYADDEQKSDDRNRYQGYARVYLKYGLGTPQSLLEGPDWSIAGQLQDLQVVQPELGGTLLDLSEGPK